MSEDARGRDESGLDGQRLHAHVGEQVDRRLLHRRVGRGVAAIVIAVEAPRPLHRAGAEHERAARVPVQRQRNVRRAGA